MRGFSGFTRSLVLRWMEGCIRATCDVLEKGGWEWEGGREGITNAPVFIIMCMDARGKMVAWPGVRTSVTSRAPFSWYMYVVVLPRTATTKLTALGCQWGGSIEHGPRFNMATGKRESVKSRKRECVDTKKKVCRSLRRTHWSFRRSSRLGKWLRSCLLLLLERNCSSCSG